MTVMIPISNEILQEAIELLTSECFFAMHLANAMGGTSTPVWELVRKVKLSVLVEDALDRGLPVRDFRSAVDNTPFTKTKAYLELLPKIGNRPDFPKEEDSETTTKDN